jgi:uncharacterized Tic20 family protein
MMRVRNNAHSLESPMRDWLLLLAPLALVAYFVVFPNQLGAFIAWAAHFAG